MRSEAIDKAREEREGGDWGGVRGFLPRRQGRSGGPNASFIDFISDMLLESLLLSKQAHLEDQYRPA